MSKTARLNEEPRLPSCDAQACALLDRLEQAIWVYDVSRHRIFWSNLAGLRFWKAASVSELARRDFNPNSQGTADRLANLAKRLAGGGHLVEHWTLYPNGEPHQLRCRFSGVALPGGAFGLMIEVTPDLQEDHESGYERRAIEAVRGAPLMISLVTPGGHWLMHNPAAESMIHEVGQHNIPNMDNFLALFTDRDAAASLRAEALEAGYSQATLRVSGSTFRMHEVMARRVNDPVTGRISLILSQLDATRSFKLEKRLRKALERERSLADSQREFFSLTSHEFKTPLSIIDGSARRIEKIVAGMPAVTDKIRSIRRAVLRMSEAVDNTLATAGIAEGKLNFHPELLDIRPLLEDAVATQQTLHPERPFHLSIPHLSQVRIDSALVEQVFENILSNAIKYSPAGAPIEVTASLQAEAIVISVTDHGIGVPEDEIPQLFTRFFRSRNTTGVKGTGVGLHTVRHFMELHKGRVAIQSREGQGSTLSLTFPLPVE